MFLASGSTNIKIYNCENWNVQFTHGEENELVKCMKWSDDGRYLAKVGSSNAEILCVTDERVRNVQSIPVIDATSICFYKGGPRNLAVGSKSGKTYIWDTKSKRIIKSFQSSSPVKFIDLNSKNTILACALENGETIVNGITTNNQLGVVKVPHSSSVSSLAFHKEVRPLLGVATDEGSILIRDLSAGKDKMFMKTAHGAPITGIDFSPINRDVMVSCSYDKKLHIYDIKLQTIVSTINTDKFLTCVNINSETHVALGTNKGEILIYDLRNFKKPLKLLNHHTSTVNQLGFQPCISNLKLNSNFNISSHELSHVKVSTPKSPTKHKELVNVSDVIENVVSPVRLKSLNNVTSKMSEASHDSFLANIVDQTNISEVSINTTDSKQIVTADQKLLSTVSNAKLKNSQSCEHSVQQAGLASISTSTPVDVLNNRFARKDSNEDALTPSPIIRNIRTSQSDFNGNSKPVLLGFKKSIDSPDCESGVETVKGNPNYISDLGNELKKLQYSIADVSWNSCNNYVNITLQQAKNRLFLEDQFSMLNQKMQSLHEMIHILSEENKKLRIDFEILRASKQ